VRPDDLTLAAVPVQVAIAACLIGGLHFPPLWLAVAPLAFTLMALNALDGSLARATGTGSTRGTVLNEITDRIGDLLIVGAGFIVAPFPIAAAAIVAVSASEIISLIGWAATGERVFTGPMGKPDRAACLGVGATLSVLWAPALTLTFAVIAVGASAGAVMRARRAFAHATAIDAGTLR
jgi:phosphatidylglycerophosphate synthase